MMHKLEISDEDLAELHELLDRELRHALVEQHRTDDWSYKTYMNRHVAALERLRDAAAREMPVTHEK